jgi:hypothetical protein
MRGSTWIAAGSQAGKKSGHLVGPVEAIVLRSNPSYPQRASDDGVSV